MYIFTVHFHCFHVDRNSIATISKERKKMLLVVNLHVIQYMLYKGHILDVYIKVLIVFGYFNMSGLLKKCLTAVNISLNSMKYQYNEFIYINNNTYFLI